MFLQKPQPRNVARSIASVLSHASTIQKSASGDGLPGGGGGGVSAIGAIEKTNSGPVATMTPPCISTAPQSTLQPSASSAPSIVSFNAGFKTWIVDFGLTTCINS